MELSPQGCPGSLSGGTVSTCTSFSFLRCCNYGSTSEFGKTNSTESNFETLEGGVNKVHTGVLLSERFSQFGDTDSSGASNAGGGSPTTTHVMSKTRSLENGRLLDEYTLEQLIGQGSFGIVFACKSKNDGDATVDLAVKLVDKVETPPEDIQREIHIQRKLDHPNILKVYKVIDEKCFVCLIMDRFVGGDLVKVLQKQATTGQRLRSSKVVKLAKQMLEAIVYMHSQSICHRDIKADNYLVDSANLSDPNIRVKLADFGFACECRSGDRLRRKCGTRSYWSPEVWDRNYAVKVDVWALGVTLHGICDGSFPFSTEWDVKNKEIRMSPLIGRRCAEFIQALLIKTEAKRPSAVEATQLRWFTSAPDSNEADAAQTPQEWHPTLRAVAPNPAVAQRRLELVERLEAEQAEFAQRRLGHEGSDSSGICRRKPGGFWVQDSERSGDTSVVLTPLALLAKPSFEVPDRLADKIRTFEWWSKAQVEAEGIHNFRAIQSSSALSEDGDRFAEEDNAVYIHMQVVDQMLKAQDIDTSTWGTGCSKSLERFAAEVESGASQLMIDAAQHKALVRVVDVVLLRLAQRCGNDVQYLVVAADEQLDGRKRSDLNRLPGTKKKPYENVRAASERILQEMPDVLEKNIAFNFDCREVFEEEEESPSYPGVRTVYRKEIVEGFVDTEPTDVSRKESMPDMMKAKSERSIKFFHWLTSGECEEKGVKLTAAKQGACASSLVPAPVGLKVKALGRYLKANNIDASAFGKNGAKTLQELSTELIAGESALVVSPSGAVLRVVDVVLLVVTRAGTNDMLVVTKELTPSFVTGAPTKKLPGTKRRPDENHFLAAKRVLQRQLKMNDNHVTMDGKNVQTLEEDKDSPSYPGLRTVYRKRIISASVEAAQGSILGHPSNITSNTSNQAAPGEIAQVKISAYPIRE